MIDPEACHLPPLCAIDLDRVAWLLRVSGRALKFEIAEDDVARESAVELQEIALDQRFAFALDRQVLHIDVNGQRISR
ncbi:MAG TPA: hypothetical protein VGD79_07195 [Thermoanaerobaculia bacterium]